MSEIHLFIIWKNALYKKEEILNNINNKFKIINMYNVVWSNEKYSENLSRFYGTKLPDGSSKEQHCGRGAFLLIIVKDNNPKYDYRETTAGREFVNINMFDSKTLYREWTGGGHKVHCTNTIEETNHDLTLLLGKNIEDYLKNNKLNSNKIINISKDLFGSDGFNSVENMFYALNNCVNYAILRNYEILPSEIYVNEHNDIDLICESRESAAYILNAKKVQELDYRVQYNVSVEGKIVNFDLRYIGDGYYDEKLEKDILKNRVFNENGFYTLSSEYYFYTLLYHALIQKLDFPDDYKQRLMNMNTTFNKDIANSYEKAVKFLEEWMLEKRYIATRPIDKTVIYNHNMLEYLKPFVYRSDAEEIFLREENKKLKIEIDNVKCITKNATDELNKIIYSRTWKCMKPIKKLNKIFKR